MIAFNCPRCGREFKSEPEYAGKKFVCPKCDAECRIPLASVSVKSVAASPKFQKPIATSSTTAATPDTDTKMLHFKCPGCDKSYKFKDEHAGRKFACTECGEECRIPTLQELQKPSAIAIADPVPNKAAPTPPPPKRPIKTSANPPKESAEAVSAQTETAVEPEPLPDASDQVEWPASAPTPSPLVQNFDTSPIWRKLERNAGSPRFWIGLGVGVLALNLASIGVTLWATGFFAKGTSSTSGSKLSTKKVKLTTKQLSSAAEAIKALGRIEAAVEIGVNHQQYTKLIIDANADVNEAKRTLPDYELLSHITDAIEAYRDAATIWSHKIEYSVLGVKEDRWGSIIHRYNVPLNKEREASHEQTMQIIWKAGSEHLANARELQQ